MIRNSDEEKIKWLKDFLRQRRVSTTSYLLIQVVALELWENRVTSQDIAAFLDKIEPNEN